MYIIILYNFHITRYIIFYYKYIKVYNINWRISLSEYNKFENNINSYCRFYLLFLTKFIDSLCKENSSLLLK